MLGLLFLVARVSSDYSCAIKDSTGQFGIFGNISGSNPFFLTGRVTADKINLSLADSASTPGYINPQNNDFMLPCDLVPDMYCGFSYYFMSYTKTPNKTFLGVPYQNLKYSFFLGQLIKWSAENCFKIPKQVEEIVDIVYAKLADHEIIGEGGAGYKLDSHFRAIREDGLKSYVRVVYDKETKDLQLLGFGGEISYVVSSETFLPNPDSPMKWFPPKKQGFMEYMYAQEAESYTVKTSNFQITLKFFFHGKRALYYTWGRLDFIQETRTESDQTEIVGALSEQRPLGSCRYKEFYYNKFELDCEEFKYEDRWYWISAQITVDGKSYKVNKSETPQSLNSLNKIYEESFVGKTCILDDTTNLKGQLITGFRWRAMDGSKLHKITLSLISKDFGTKQEYKITGCKVVD
jgi:hypothetical protein